MQVARAESRHPFEIYILSLATMIGPPTAFGEPTAGSMEAALPFWAIPVWGIGLSSGAILALVGILLLNRKPGTGLLLEQLGLAWVACGTLFYASIVMLTVGQAGIAPASFILGFGIACVIRCIQIQRSINRAVKAVKKAEEL